jgi:hypothetical protein
MSIKLLTEQPLRLPEADAEGHTAMYRWRIKSGKTVKQAAEYLGISVATLYRYEAGYTLNMRKANEIVRMTGGAVRYRDMIGNFHPEFA